VRTSFVRALTDLADRDPRVMLLTGDLGYRLFDDFARRYGARFQNMGVAEANMVSVAAGLALSGKRPFVYSIAPFATARCLEQIRDDLCNMALPVVVTGVAGGYSYGANGPTHHGVDDVALMRAMAGMTVVCPCDPWETARAVEALGRGSGPAYLRLGRSGEPDLPRADQRFELGQPTVLRHGSRVGILACGPIAANALAAADRLQGMGIEPLVLSVHTVKPLAPLIDELRRRALELIFTIEEHGPCGGLHEAVAAATAVWPGRPYVEGIGAPDEHVHLAGAQEYLRRRAGLDAVGIFERIQARLRP
jgi:transketolase